MLKIILIICIFIIASCVTTRPELTPEQKLQNIKAINDRLNESRQQSDEGWIVSCTLDQVTTIKTCRATTFGSPMSSSGEPQGSSNIPFQIYFYNHDGPFLRVGYNTYPGRKPTIRIDDNQPHYIEELLPVANIIEELLAGKIVRARYHVWPRGSEDMYIDLAGIQKAWHKLNDVKNK